METNKLSVIEILDSLEATSSRLEKESILNENKKNNLLKRVFEVSSDPYTNHYISKVKMPGANNGFMSHCVDDDEILKDFVDFVTQNLVTRKLTGNAAKDAVHLKFLNMIGNHQKWCLRILLKNLRCGVQEPTIKKVWPGLINKFVVSLARQLNTSYDKKTKKIIILEPVKYPVQSEPKLDGLRCTAVKANGVVTMYTRSGKVIETLPEIKQALEKLDYDNFTLDGEAKASTNWNDSTSVIMSKKNKKDDSNMFFNIFDAVPLDEWKKNKSTQSLSNRDKWLDFLKTSFSAETHLVRVPYILINNEKDLLAFYQKCISEGHEGIMIKDLNATYQFKRSDAMLKMKPMTTWEGVVVGWYEGRVNTARQGQFGGFEVVLPNGMVTRVGGGFNDNLRQEILDNNPDTYLNKIVEVEGQPDTETEDGLSADGRIRFPVFSRFRDASDVDQLVIKAGKLYLDK